MRWGKARQGEVTRQGTRCGEVRCDVMYEVKWSDLIWRNPFFFVHCSRHVSVSFFFCHSPFQRSVHYGQCSCLHNVLSVRQGNPDFSTQDVKLTFYPSSHFAPKNFKVVASSKKLVTIFYYDQKKYISTLQTQLSNPMKDELAKFARYKHLGYLNPRWQLIVHVLHSRNKLKEEAYCRFIFQIFQQIPR